ncbi:MAG TPA: hypothetical protein VEA60_04635 [Allosphingosinicella sp.]|nr:hypothetical protein [Allosphingosinicella sp.]
MVRMFLAALLAAACASTQAGASTPAVAVQPNSDSAEELQRLRNLSACLAKSRPRWARQTLAFGYLSDAQAREAAQALTGTDSCVPNDTEVVFRTSGLVGGLAEYFLRAEIDRADSARLTEALATLTPLNVSEDFALCVAVRDPAAARDLAFSEPGSAVEARAAAQLARHVPPCIERGEQPTVDLQSLRALMSTALYRGVTAVLAGAR